MAGAAVRDSPTMRILHVVGRSHRRGAEVVALELASELDGRGHTDTLVAVGPGHQGDRVVELAALTGAVRQHPVSLLRAARGLRREIRSRPPDVVLAHGGSALQVAVLAAGRSGPPVVYQLILGMPSGERGRVWHAWWRWLLVRTAGAVALTQVLADEIVALGLRAPVWVVPNARRADRFRGIDREACAARLREAAGIDPATMLVGFVGHLVEQKRPDRAVEVLAALRSDGHDVHLLVAGAGPLGSAVRDLVDRLGVADRVTLLGHRTDPEAVLGGLDVFLLTSDDEGMPGVAIEAQMAGCPVVSFPVGGVAEVVGDGETGIVLAAHEVDAMADAVGRLLADPARRRTMAEAALRRSQRFALEVVAGQYESLLADVVDRH